MRLLIVDDGPVGELERLIAGELPDVVAVVHSMRPRSPTLRRGVWVSDESLADLVPPEGQVMLRATSDLSWCPDPLDGGLIRALLPPDDAPASIRILSDLLPLDPLLSPCDSEVLADWDLARIARLRGYHEIAAEAVLRITERWPTWSPGWALADQIHQRLGRHEAARVCRARSGAPAVQENWRMAS
jgi:hypothetical protein